MRHLARSSSFKRAFKRYIAKHPELLEPLAKVFEALQQDPFAPFLETHKLKGKFVGHWACSGGYDLRIVFIFVDSESENAEDDILLLNIGTHDEVY